jgi:hypothetical protein
LAIWIGLRGRTFAVAVLLGTSVATCGPSANSFVVVAPDPQNAPLTVTLNDHTGYVRAVALIEPIPDSARTGIGDVDVHNIGADSVSVRWMGGACPTNATVTTTLSSNGVSLVLDRGAKCQADVGKVRVLSIEFNRPMPASSVTAIAVQASSAP